MESLELTEFYLLTYLFMQDEKYASLFDLWDGISYYIDWEQLLSMKVESAMFYLNSSSSAL